MKIPRAFTASRDFLFLHDPGLTRLWMALRGTVSVGISFLLVAYLFRQGHQSATLALAGVTLSMIAAMAVNDASVEERRITVMCLPAPAVVIMALAVLLKPWAWLSLGVFLVVIFVAVYIRRFGSRGQALGLMSFMAYFYGIYFPIPPSAVGWVLLSVLTGLACFYVIGFYVFPDQSRRQLRWLVWSYRLRAGHLLRRSHLALKEGVLPRSRERLRPLYVLVNEAALLIDDALKEKSAVGVGAESLATNSWIFEVEFTVRRFIETVSAFSERPGLPPEHRAYLEELTAVAGRLLRRPAGYPLVFSAAIPLVALPEEDAALFENVLAEFQHIRELAAGPANSPFPSDELPDAKPEPPVNTYVGGLHRHTRQAIQVTLATAVASVIGQLISPARWYWAALTAFVVFAGATRGETILRAVQRVAGTLAGLVGGFLVAYLVGGHRNVEVSLIFVCIFFGVYYTRLAPPVAAFWWTTLLAVFYQLVGTYSAEVLFLRLEETLVGAIAGIVMAAFVLPNPTRGGVRDALVPLLRHVGMALDEAATIPPSRSMRSLLFRKMRLLDRDLSALRTIAAPLVGKLVARSNPRTYRRVHDASALVHYAKHLVFAAAAESALVGKADCQARLRALAADLLKVSEKIRGEGELLREVVDPTWSLEFSPVPATREAVPHWIGRMEQLARSLAR